MKKRNKAEPATDESSTSTVSDRLDAFFAKRARNPSYFQLATKVLGREPERSGLPVPVIDWKTGEVVQSKMFPGNLTAEEDRRLCAFVGLTPSDWDKLSEHERIPFMEKALTGNEDEPPVNWADYRSSPGGPLLTVSECENRFGVRGSTLSKDPQAIKTRQKNPQGRGYVYRYDVVALIANRKSGDD